MKPSEIKVGKTYRHIRGSEEWRRRVQVIDSPPYAPTVYYWDGKVGGQCHIKTFARWAHEEVGRDEEVG